MMVQMLRTSALILVAVLLMNVVARVVGAAQAPPTRALFSTADGQPCKSSCLLGIQPGVTTYREAGMLLRRHPLIAGQYVWERSGANTLDVMGQYLTATVISDEQGNVAVISLRFQPESAQPGSIVPGTDSETELFRGVVWLGDLMEAIGSPKLVQVGQSTGGIIRMFYPQSGYVLTSVSPGNPVQKRVEIYSRLVYIGLASGRWYREAWGGPMLTANDWQGFSRAKRYFGRWQ